MPGTCVALSIITCIANVNLNYRELGSPLAKTIIQKILDAASFDANSLDRSFFVERRIAAMLETALANFARTETLLSLFIRFMTNGLCTELFLSVFVAFFLRNVC